MEQIICILTILSAEIHVFHWKVMKICRNTRISTRKLRLTWRYIPKTLREANLRNNKLRNEAFQFKTHSHIHIDDTSCTCGMLARATVFDI